MRLPQPLLESPYFIFSSLTELLKALGNEPNGEEIEAIQRLDALGLPPVTSRHVLGTMFGISPSLIWSMQTRTARYYRSFSIPKGKGKRNIDAPRVGLKIIQKWLSVHLDRFFATPSHVHGFVKGRSYINAASAHAGATWILSVDIKDFFQTTPLLTVQENLMSLGFEKRGAELIANLACLRGYLAQGSPLSPVLSNICFKNLDEKLSELADAYGTRLTRYADDIVFSSTSEYPAGLKEELLKLFDSSPWKLAAEKTELSIHPLRRKVHGLLVHGEIIRLTKGYRHRLRAYRHLLAKNSISDEDLSRVKGHLAHAAYIDRISKLSIETNSNSK